MQRCYMRIISMILRRIMKTSMRRKYLQIQEILMIWMSAKVEMNQGIVLRLNLTRRKLMKITLEMLETKACHPIV